MTINNSSVSKLLAIGLLLALLLLAWLIVIRPYVNYFAEQYYSIERANHKLIALNYLIKKEEDINTLYRSIKNNRSLERVYLGKAGGVVAEAKLQGIVRRLIEKNQSNMIQSSLISYNSDDKKAVTIKVTMRGSIESAYKIFYELENSRPVMIINNIELTRMSKGYSRNVKNEWLNSVFEITAYVQ